MFSTPAGAGTAVLTEREGELASIQQAIDDAAAGRGRVILVEAPAGAGKTALLDAGAQLAARAGLHVLRARGAELEQDLGFGIPGQLFGRVVHSRPELLRGTAALAAPALGGEPVPMASGEPLYAALQGLYWLAVDLAEQTPLALAVDDTHWADPASERFLAHLAHRIDELALLLIIARRPPPRDGHAASGLAGAELLTPQPLSETGTAAVIRSLVPGVSPEQARAGYRATGGNPFYVHAVARAARDAAPGDLAAPDWSPAAITRTVAGQLERLGPEARRLAGAISILGPGTSLRHARAIAGLAEGAAAQAIDALAAADLLDAEDPREFTHPILRAAVRDQLGPGERADLHRRAARLLDREGASPARTAVHLLHCDAAGDDWTVTVLHAAAREALTQGAPEAAAGYLRRALEETPAPAELVGLLVDLAQAEAATFDREAAAGRLEEAYAMAADRGERLVVASHLAILLGHSVGNPQGIRLLARTRQDFLDAPEIALRIEARMANIGRGDRSARRLSLPEPAARLRATADGESDPEVLSAAAAELVMTAAPVERARTLARRALERRPPAMTPEGGLAQHVAARVLILAEDFERAEAALLAAREGSRRTGSILGAVFTTVYVVELLLRRGELLEAEAEAEGAYAIASEYGWPAGAPWLAASMVEILIERDRADQAMALLAEADLLAPARELSGAYSSNLVLAARGRLHLARGDAAAALEDLQECGRREEEWGEHNPAVVRWRTPAAEALAALGDREAARALAREELGLARRFGTPRSLGAAARVCARLTPGPEGDALAGEACDVLAGSAARLEYAHALADRAERELGHGRTDVARPLLESALELADRCAAGALEAQVRQQLRVIGARPRRAQRTGPRSLTPSERQIAALAAEGRPNREIAELLFITQRTVEFHLSHVYRKLGIASRRELARAIALAPPPADR